MEIYLQIPKERIGVLIGKNGETKKRIEAEAKVKLEIDSEEGDVTIISREDAELDRVLKVRDIVSAIARGFAPDKAYILFNDDYIFETIDINEFTGKSKKHKFRIRARIIGTRGKAREHIEKLTETAISVYGDTVSIIGNISNVELAKKSVEMLLKGSEHRSVYNFIEKRKKEIYF